MSNTKGNPKASAKANLELPGGESTFTGLPMQESKFMQWEEGGFIDSGFGQKYPTRKSLTISPDEIQGFTQVWKFNAAGYHNSGSPTVLPREYTGPYQLLQDYWKHARNIIIGSLQDEWTLPTALNTATWPQVFCEVYLYAVANLAMMMRLGKLVQYNQAFSTVDTYLSKKFSRLAKLYGRAVGVTAPTWLKVHALRNSEIVYWPGKCPPIVRMWTESGLGAYGGAANYTDQNALQLTDILTNETNFDNFIDNIEKAIWFLECNVTSSANATADTNNLRAVFRLLAKILPKLYAPGLPKIDDLVPLTFNPSVLSDIFGRAIYTNDTKGVGTDQNVVFPAYGQADFGNQIPIKGVGDPEANKVYNSTALGAIKFGSLNTLGLNYCDVSTAFTLIGTDRQFGGTTFTTINRKGSWFTREAGAWTLVNEFADFGDGSSIRSYLNIGSPLVMHAFWPAVFAAQLTTNMDTPFVDNSWFGDYTIWIDPEDVMGNYALFLGRAMGVPYLR